MLKVIEEAEGKNFSPGIYVEFPKPPRREPNNPMPSALMEEYYCHQERIDAWLIGESGGELKIPVDIIEGEKKERYQYSFFWDSSKAEYAFIIMNSEFAKILRVSVKEGKSTFFDLLQNIQRSFLYPQMDISGKVAIIHFDNAWL
jgi:hypothetical protein